MDDIYTCSVCAKICFEEISHARHEKYCRRRATKPPRPKACGPCRKTKSKCNFGWPCSRCANRQIVCSYEKGGFTIDADIPLLMGDAGTSDKALDNPDDSRSKAIIPFTMSQLDLITRLDMEVFQGSQANLGETINVGPTSFIYIEGWYRSTLVSGDSFATLFSKSISAIVQAQNQSSIASFTFDNKTINDLSAPLDLINFSAYNELPLLSNKDSASSRPLETTALHSTLTPNLSTPLSEQYLTRACRQHIMSTLRAYPRMMTRSNNLPPFIHRVGCGLHYSEQTALDGNNHSFAPLSPLAACADIARIFCSGNPTSNEFLWRSIDNEQRRIADELDRFSKGEILAAMQATLIYVIMRLMSFGPEYFERNRDLQKLTKTSCLRLHRPNICAHSPSHIRASRPTWEEWIFEETQRRVVIVGFLLSLIIGSDPCNVLADPRLMNVPGEKTLWEARTRWDWEMEYSRSLIDGSPLGIQTMSDLAIAKFGSKIDGRAGNSPDDALDDWHAGLDNLGMLFAATLAGI
ncbi:unnamed protein product [Periconia digitata]|uniref:Zn(2)-C6 fungal-type domain-containing protein n=1 Tax=Periconia digitata TaxID=1303443 RepID=A0A9W4XHC7_9PLEO|nr:unnamed protein product [Periconia digitata]